MSRGNRFKFLIAKIKIASFLLDKLRRDVLKVSEIEKIPARSLNQIRIPISDSMELNATEAKPSLVLLASKMFPR